ncbi:MAG: sulfate permease [Pirellulales bacterium]
MPRLLPASVVCLREGYTRRILTSDLVAGLTVGIIALPMAIAFGINSIPESVAREAGISPPAMGLYTAVVAGFLISLLGGSRVQIGGPTGAFIVIVSAVASRHGYGGLATATLMAGAIVTIMGLFRFGAMIKFIPYPVTTGFTSGIAVIILTSQVKDFFGLSMAAPPSEFAERVGALGRALPSWDVATTAVAAGSLLMLVGLRRFAPRVPGAIVTVVLAAFVVWACGLSVETIEARFGAIPQTLPAPHLPELRFDRLRELIPDATTIALLIAIESLLSAVVADGMTGQRHKSDCELVGQGVANVASVVFGGIPATGAIARTAANVKSGGRTPLAGMIHAVTLAGVMAVAAPLAGAIPLATLAAVLVVVAWNMSEIQHFRSILRAPLSDTAVLLTTFGLTVFVDLTVAVGVGMVLASFLFMKRMAEVSNVSALTAELRGDDDELGELKDPNALDRRHVPNDVEVFEINGPFFFGVADRLHDVLGRLERPPKVFILRMRRVPAIDASGLHALGQFHAKCKRQGTALLLSGVHAQPLFAFVRHGFDDVIGSENMFGNIDDALNAAREILGLPPEPPPRGARPEVAREQAAEERDENAA